MYDFFKPIELNRTYQQTEKAIKDTYNFWIGIIADTFTLDKAKEKKPPGVLSPGAKPSQQRRFAHSSNEGGKATRKRIVP